ncbi:MAG: hypothetical protein J6X94_03665 [Lachnospiraceae bacterium]|nr:hypothetical protein [Lachnospiraceae bacterium]
MRKIISLIMISLMLMIAGCGNNVTVDPDHVTDDSVVDGSSDIIEDHSDEHDDEILYQLIVDEGFETDEVSYSVGDKVNVYYNIIASDTDYSFYADSEDVELDVTYDEEKGYVITFKMPAHDVSLYVNTVNSIEYNEPNGFDEVPEDAWNALLKYVGSRTQLMATIPVSVCMADVTEDGHDDVCATFITGSGFVTSMIVIYDTEKKRGYTLSHRGTYDYEIEGIEDGILLVKRMDYGHKEEDVTGTIVISSGWPIFLEDIDILKKGLPYKAITMFAYCAEELLPGDTSSGNYLSSMDFQYVRQMMWKVCGIFYGGEMYEQEVTYEDGKIETLPTTLVRMPYDEWVYLIEEVFMEKDAGDLLANLDDSFHGEISVYYSSDDDYIYLQQGMIGDIVEWELTDVSKDGTRYVLTYDIFGFEWLWTAEVTIEEADNTYGYRLIGVEIVDEAEDVDWAR